jgi:hypothetical protein
MRMRNEMSRNPHDAMRPFEPRAPLHHHHQLCHSYCLLNPRDLRLLLSVVALLSIVSLI